MIVMDSLRSNINEDIKEKLDAIETVVSITHGGLTIKL